MLAIPTQNFITLYYLFLFWIQFIKLLILMAIPG